MGVIRKKLGIRRVSVIQVRKYGGRLLEPSTCIISMRQTRADYCNGLRSRPRNDYAPEFASIIPSQKMMNDFRGSGDMHWT
jgi:hypothetical protein